MTTNACLTGSPRESGKGALERRILDEIAQALQGMRFGSVEIVVHEGKVTQIERKEKFRLHP